MSDWYPVSRPLSPVTRSSWSTAKASSAADNGTGLYVCPKQTADCPLVLIHLYSALSHCCRHTHTHTHLLLWWLGGEKFCGPHVGMYTHVRDGPALPLYLLFLSLIHSLISLYPSFPTHPSILPSTLPSLSELRTSPLPCFLLIGAPQRQCSLLSQITCLPGALSPTACSGAVPQLLHLQQPPPPPPPLPPAAADHV